MVDLPKLTVVIQYKLAKRVEFELFEHETFDAAESECSPFRLQCVLVTHCEDDVAMHCVTGHGLKANREPIDFRKPCTQVSAQEDSLETLNWKHFLEHVLCGRYDTFEAPIFVHIKVKCTSVVVSVADMSEH